MNNSQEEEREVVLGLLKFIGTGLTVTAAIISIAVAISKARSLEPQYIYTIPYTQSLSIVSGPTKSGQAGIFTRDELISAARNNTRITDAHGADIICRLKN